MDTHFIFNKFVTGKNYIGRKTETQILGNLLAQGENIAIYEPPKAGKTSIIQQAFFNMRIATQKFAIVEFSMLNTRTIADMMMRLGTAILKNTGNTPSDYAHNVERWLPGTHFIFDPALFESKGSILSLNWDIDDNDIRAIFELPYKVAADRNTRTYVVIDEFQNVMLTEDGDKVCKILESVFAHLATEQRKHASYIFSGSQVNGMKDIFEIRRYFYRQYERVALSPIDSKDITDHVVKGFLASGKVLDRDLLMGVCKLFKGNIWYINHFSSICDSLSKGYIMEPVLEESLNTLLSIHEPRFVAMMNDLTTFQVCLLRAILDGHTKFSSSEVISRYNLNSSANVRRLKDALCKKEIITFGENDAPVILDPLFEYWARKYFFEIGTN